MSEQVLKGYQGIFFDEKIQEELARLQLYGLSYIVDNMHITFNFGELSKFPDELMKKDIPLKIIGYASDGKNSGFQVELPEEIQRYYKNQNGPHITVSIGEVDGVRGKPVDTGKLNFQKLEEPIEITGQLGYFKFGATREEKGKIVMDNSLFEETKEKFNLKEALEREDVVEYFKGKSKEEIEELLGPEVAKMVGFKVNGEDLWEHTLRAVEAVNKDEERKSEYFSKDTVRIGALLHDIGKPYTTEINPKTGEQTFFGYAKKSKEIAKEIVSRLVQLGFEDIECFVISAMLNSIENQEAFVNYKAEVPENMKNDEFIREITPETVAEALISIELQPYLESEGYDIHQIKYIISLLASGKKPEFRDENGEVIDNEVDYYDLLNRLGCIQSETDREILLALCKADAKAENNSASEKKLDSLAKIEEVIEESNVIANECFMNPYDIVKSIMREEFKEQDDNREAILKYIEKFGIDDVRVDERVNNQYGSKYSDFGTSSVMGDLIKQHGNDKEFMLKAILSETKYRVRNKELIEEEIEEIEEEDFEWFVESQPIYLECLKQMLKGHMIDYASEELKLDPDIIKAMENPDMIPEILEKIGKEQHKHTAEEIAAGISPSIESLENALNEMNETNEHSTRLTKQAGQIKSGGDEK